MRRLLLLLALPVLACAQYTVGMQTGAAGSSGGGTITLVAHGNAGAGSQTGTATVSGLNTTGSSLLLMFCADYNYPSSDTVSDSVDGHSNSWARIGIYNASTTYVSVFYAWGSSLYEGSGHSFSCSGGFTGLVVLAFSGIQTSSNPLDQSTGGGTGGTSLQPGSITPTANGELIITMLGQQANGTASINDGFTIGDSITYSGSANMGCAAAYYVQSSAAAINPTWTTTVFDPIASLIASFKP